MAIGVLPCITQEDFIMKNYQVKAVPVNKDSQVKTVKFGETHIVYHVVESSGKFMTVGYQETILLETVDRDEAVRFRANQERLGQSYI